MKNEELAIWWLTQEECEAIRQSDRNLPGYLGEEFDSRHGRPGRGRLWVPKNLGTAEVKPWPNKPMARFLGANAGGIVIDRDDVPMLAEFPGIVTDMELRRLE
jgi:hypothetical protein